MGYNGFKIRVRQSSYNFFDEVRDPSYIERYVKCYVKNMLSHVGSA